MKLGDYRVSSGFRNTQLAVSVQEVVVDFEFRQCFGEGKPVCCGERGVGRIETGLQVELLEVQRGEG